MQFLTTIEFAMSSGAIGPAIQNYELYIWSDYCAKMLEKLQVIVNHYSKQKHEIEIHVPISIIIVHFLKISTRKWCNAKQSLDFAVECGVVLNAICKHVECEQIIGRHVDTSHRKLRNQTKNYLRRLLAIWNQKP